MNRRDFLRLGSAGVVVFAASGSASARNLLSGPSTRVAWRAHWGAPEVDATRLDRGDSDLERVGARITVFGLAPEASDDACPASLDVHFAGMGRHARFHAWSRADPAVCGEPAPAAFVVALDARGRLTIEPSWDGIGLPVTLSSRSDPGCPRLRCGVYLFSAASAPAIVATVARGDRIGPSRPPWRNEDAGRSLYR